MSLKNQNIVIVTSEFPPQPGGIGNHAYNLALYLSKENYTVHVIADQRSETGKEEIIFDLTLPFEVTRIKRHNLRFRMYFQRLIMTRKRFKSASHIIATGKFSLWNVGFLSIFKKTPTIAVIHGTEVNFKSFILRKSIDIALKKFDCIVAVSNYTKHLVSHLNLNIEVIPNGIDFAAWQLIKKQDLTLKGEPSLTTVGRVSSRKGQLNVIKQLPELIKQFPKIHYHCIGIPTQIDAFIIEAKRLQVHDYITFHGSVDAQVLKQMLSETDLFVMLSSEDKFGDVEGFGIAILEANALGIPAIGSKGCGIEDAIQQNVSGLLVEFNKTKQTKEAIDIILSNKVAYKNGAKKWAEQHDWSNIIKQYITLM
ncbi:glycosyltransferase family 4 protein [Psychroserpens jangbogonensis]|uniref:glycosyltransferase family 4 protein n=1 Tax=Psychroserpens jangbogonensis TaxID=1484460 RepID=UPI000A48F7AE|nr:glycosyltransferase family 4 protein [Psychroserpens jangbogonensis]